MHKIYKILEETIRFTQVTKSFTDQLSEMKFIYIDGDFISPKKLSFELGELEQIPPYLIKLPDSLDCHYRLFKEIGMSRSPTFRQYSFALSQLHRDIGDRELSESETRRVRLAVRGFVSSASQSDFSLPDADTQPPQLFLISDNNHLVNSQLLLFDDDAAISFRISKPLTSFRGFMAPASNYDLCDSDFVTLPESFRPRPLTSLIEERFGINLDSDKDSDSTGSISTSLKQRFNSIKFASAILRLVKHRMNSQKESIVGLDFKAIEMRLRDVKVHAVCDLYTYLEFKGEPLLDSERRCQCYLHRTNTQSIIYLDSEVTSMTPDLSACLSELLESLVGVRLPLHVVMAMLTTPLCDLRPLLDRMRIGRDANQRDDESPHLQIHRTGTCFPIDQRHLLTTDYDEFKVGEIAVYRKDTNDEEDSYVYIRILRQIGKVDDLPYVTGHYLVDSGNEKKLQVSSVDLYKLQTSRRSNQLKPPVPGSRDHTPSRNHSFKRRSMVDNPTASHTSTSSNTPKHTPIPTRRVRKEQISDISDSDSEFEKEFQSDLLSRRRSRFNNTNGDSSTPANVRSTPNIRLQRQRDRKLEAKRRDKLERTRREEEARLRRKHGIDPMDSNKDSYNPNDVPDIEISSYKSRFYGNAADVDEDSSVYDREDVLEGEEPTQGEESTQGEETQRGFYEDEIDAEKTHYATSNDSRIADFIGTKDSKRKDAMRDEMKKLADDIEDDLNAVSDQLEDAWKLEDKERRKIVKRLMLRWHPDKNPDNIKVSTIIMQHIYKEIERLTEGLPRPEQFKDFDFSNIDPRNPFAHSDKFKANYYQSYKDFFEKVQKRSKENREERRRYKEQQAKAKPARKGFGYDFNDDEGVDRTAMFIKQAEIDLVSSYNDYTNQEEYVKTVNYEWACFKSHQAAEKALKAAQFFTDNSTSFSHDLMSIAATIKDIEIRKLANCLQKIIGESSKFYNADPMDFHSSIPHDEYSEDMALDCSKYAEQILDKVKEYIEIQKNSKREQI